MEQDTVTLYRAYATRDARFDGRVFAGVRTTGIYCRPVCPARLPKRENMTFFPTAAAAQAAGYRPCLRCRPEAAPDFAGWRGDSAVVHRTLAIIEDGWLEDRGIDDLADEVGVSGRQLRRLFRQHLGATPVAVAQTRRVLLARQLIQETSLSMADVAMASGFGSVRRFNETFHGLFGRPPGELRRQRPTGATDATGLAIRLPYRPPYDWDTLLDQLRQSAIPGVEQVTERRYVRSVQVGDHAGWIDVRPSDGDAIDLTVHTPDLEALPRIIRRVRRRFDLSADPVAIDGQLAEDPLLAPLVADRPGLRVAGVWDGFEEAVRTMTRSDPELLAALVTEHGRPIDDPAAHEAGLSHTFPAPHDLLGRAATSIEATAIPTAIVSLATAVANAPSLLDQHRDPDQTRRHLAGLAGIDDPLAATLVSQILECHDTIPPDAAMLSAGPNAPFVSPADLRRRTAGWSPWRAYGIAYLLAGRRRRDAGPPTHSISKESHYVN